MFDDPLCVVSCDPPLGWAVTTESSALRLVLRHLLRPRESIVVAIHPALCAAAGNEVTWIAAACEAYDCRAGASPIQLAETTAIRASWREGDVVRTRIARRGATLDLVLDHRGEADDERTHRLLLQLAAGARSAVWRAQVGPEEIKAALERVDAAATEGRDAFLQALLFAEGLLSERWETSVATGLAGADFAALQQLASMELWLSAATSDVRRLMRSQSMGLRARTQVAIDAHDIPVDDHFEAEVRECLAGLLSSLPSLFAKIRHTENEAEDATPASLSDAGLALQLALDLLGTLRRELREAGADYDREDAFSCAREIVDAVVFACIERQSDSTATDCAFFLGEPLIAYLDCAGDADRMQDLAEGAALLEDVALLAQSAADNEDDRKKATRLLLVATVAKAKAAVSLGNESSLRDALDVLGRARRFLRGASGDTSPDLLNILHLEALAALELGELELARDAAVAGSAAAGRARDAYHAEYFRWIQDSADHLDPHERKVRTLPEIEFERGRGESFDRVMDRVCRGIADAIDENPLSLILLERLVLAGMVAPEIRHELEAAATALVDLRRLLLTRARELRIDADDSLLVRKLAAGNLESLVRQGQARDAALAAEHACGRSLVLDLTEVPTVVMRIRDAIRVRYADAMRVSVERRYRANLPEVIRKLPPWAPPLLRAGPWLLKRGEWLRQWCAQLSGVLGGTPLTASELSACVDLHGEPVLLLHPVAGRICGFILRPGRDPELVQTEALVTEVREAIARMRSELGVWASARARSPAGDEASAETVDRHRLAAAVLFDKLLAPFASKLADSVRLTIVPYRELATVPFATLIDEAGRPACERWVLSTASSISMLGVLNRRQAPGGAGRAFVLGDPDTGDAQLSRLAGAAEEASSLANELRGATPPWDLRLVVDREASVAEYRGSAADATLVHLACHASVGNVARDSALLLAPTASQSGLLKAPDIEAVGLHSALVFLSACRTGTGRPSADGTIGLSRAFLTAGASAVVASLWNLPDASTTLLVGHFYASYLSGTDVAAALQQAMLKTRDELARHRGCMPHEVPPVEWGGLFVLGRGRLVCMAPLDVRQGDLGHAA